MSKHANAPRKPEFNKQISEADLANVQGGAMGYPVPTMPMPMPMPIPAIPKLPALCW